MSRINGNFYGQGSYGYPPPPHYGPPICYRPSYFVAPLHPYGYAPTPPPPQCTLMPLPPPSGNYMSGWRHYKGNNFGNYGGSQNCGPPNACQQNWNANGGGKKRKINNGPQNGFKGLQEKRQKMDKRDLPENNKYSCETCNRGFRTEEQYQTHVETHVKCSFDGCHYEAHEKLVQMHVEHVHLSGYADKMKSAKNTEQWIEERRRNYPTKENIARKEKERQEAIERGEIPATRGRGRLWMNKGRQKFQGRGCIPYNQHRNQFRSEAPGVIETGVLPVRMANKPNELRDASIQVENRPDNPPVPVQAEAIDEFPASKPTVPLQGQITAELPNSIDLHASSQTERLEKSHQPGRNTAHRNGGIRRREPLARMLLVQDIKNEMNAVLQIAAFFTKRMQEASTACKNTISQNDLSNMKQLEKPGTNIEKDQSMIKKDKFNNDEAFYNENLRI